ncbi:unnamed protein product [Brassica napus]|uniref:(rape) hypothetical protein n=1 Tax=Brassica napus TaxID=3708 RepID=A0A816IBH1_BRANA|nr:unnamed protein product [Brassica napus]
MGMGIKQENLDKPAAQFQYVISDQICDLVGGKASLVLKAWVLRSEVQAYSVLLSGHLSDLDQFEDCGSGSVGSLPAVRLFEEAFDEGVLFSCSRGSSPSHRVFYYKMLETDVLCSVSPLEAVMCFQASYGDLSSGDELIRYLRRVNQIFPLFRETTLPPREASLSDYSLLSPQLFQLLVALVPSGEYNTSSSSTSNHYLRLSVRLSAMELMQFLSPGVIPFLSPEDSLVKKCHCHRSRPLCMLVCFK